MSVLNQHLITLLILLPVVGAFAIAVTRRESETLQKILGLAFSTVLTLVALPTITVLLVEVFGVKLVAPDPSDATPADAGAARRGSG